jgi:dTMP kinase
MPGTFITFEGGEGTGKSSQLAVLRAALCAGGRAVVETQEPGGTTIGREIRGILLNPARTGMTAVAELLLYEASRAQLVGEVIRPALARGEVVLCDRFTDSTVAYQGYGRGLELDIIESLNRLVSGGLRPDCTFLLDLDPAAGLARVRQRTPEDRMEAEVLEFHRRVREGFLAIARREPDRVVVLDGTRPPGEIATRIRDRVTALLGAARAAR